MKIKDENQYLEELLTNPKTKRYITIGIVAALITTGIYVLGHLFKISAHTIRGFNELKSAVRNG